MVLNITHDIICMDDVLDVRRMPLSAVILLQKAGTMAILLHKNYNRNIGVLQPIIGSLKRASKQWPIASKLISPSQDYKS
jgi:hypothetical protein